MKISDEIANEMQILTAQNNLYSC